VRISCDLVNPNHSELHVDVVDVDDIKDVSELHFTQPDLHAMWFNLRIHESNPLQDDRRQPEGTWGTYPFLCYSSFEKFEIDSMEAGSIVALPDG
jgi:hypothetical protein